jgi:hypothetical protein
MIMMKMAIMMIMIVWMCGQAFATERAVHEILQRKVLLPHTNPTQKKES